MMDRGRPHALVPGGLLLGLALLPALAPADAAAGAVCPEADSVALIAGKNTTAGEVKVCNDAETLSVTYEPTAPWCVADTNLHVATEVADIPRTPSGNPIPGQFDYGGPPEGDDCTVTFEIPLAEIGTDGVAAEDEVVIAAQADLFVLEGAQEEGAWGAGTRFTPRGNWATYFTYTVEDVTCGEDSKCVFVTSATYNGSLGGLSGADAKCQALADADGSLVAPGTYKAWLSDSSAAPAGGRFTMAEVPYRLANGTRIATSWSDLIDGTLEAPIDRDEAGLLVPSSAAWTNTTPGGLALHTSFGTCMQFMITSRLFDSDSIVGATSATNGTWSQWFLALCDQQHRLYCFQQ